MRYPFRCVEHGEFEIARSMAEGPPPDAPCPTCSETSERVYTVSPVVYYGSGFHATDYFKGSSRGRGQSMNRVEALNADWSKKTGEAPPPPSGGKE